MMELGTPKYFIIFLSFFVSAVAFRGNSNRASSLGSSSQSSNQLNIGLIAPHTNFGKFNFRKSQKSSRFLNFFHLQI